MAFKWANGTMLSTLPVMSVSWGRSSKRNGWSIYPRLRTWMKRFPPCSSSLVLNRWFSLMAFRWEYDTKLRCDYGLVLPFRWECDTPKLVVWCLSGENMTHQVTMVQSTFQIRMWHTKVCCWLWFSFMPLVTECDTPRFVVWCLSGENVTHHGLLWLWFSLPFRWECDTPSFVVTTQSFVVVLQMCMVWRPFK